MKLNRKKTEEVEVDMSPMIDMVFLLLIFFLVASTIIDEKKPVEVPVALNSKVPEDTTGRFELTVTSDGAFWLGPNREVTIDEIKELLGPRLEADPKLRILIRADKNVKYKVNEELMEACAEVGASDLIFSAFEN
jgi:biopolymer transport protein ExbD